VSDRDPDGPDESEPLVPDAVIGRREPTEEAPRRRPDRTSLWAMIAGLAACWFTLFGPLLAILLAPIALILGRRALKRVARDEGTDRERRQARIGFAAGTVAAVLLVLQVVLFQLFFEWEKDVPEVEPKSATTSSTAPATPTTTEPPG
jgi:hypothetical protein